MVMLKERGPKEATIIWLGTWVGAFVVGGIVANILVYIPL
jgi:ferrous iron transport protein B